MEKGKSVMVDPVKEKLNHGSGKVVTNDVKGNQQLYAKETKIYLDQRKMDTREEKNLKRELQDLQAKELTNRRQYEEELARLELQIQEIEGEQIDVNKEKLNKGSGKVVTNDIKEMKVYLDQKKKMDIREDYKEFNDYYKHRVNIFLKY